MSTFIGDFMGFTLGDVHSSQLNIVRVSSGDRYAENLTPNFSDNTLVVPGGVGTYYWNTSYTQKPFIIDFAFDDLRDEDIRKLKQIFNFNGVKQLIFDEAPYKKYYVKCSSPPTLKFLPFGERNDVIIYKGEGTVNLVAYYPYAVSVVETELQSDNLAWIDNIGDVSTPCKIYYSIDNTARSFSLSFIETISGIVVTHDLLTLSNVKRKKTSDNYICIDSRTHLVEGLDSYYEKTGTLYNEYISYGDFFLLPTRQIQLSSNVNWNKVKFNYLYY